MGKVTKSASCWLFVGIMMLFGFMSCLSPSGNDGKVGLDTVSLTYGVDVINVHAGTANETGISPMWSLADTTGITYSIAAAETGGPETDGVDSGVINIAPATGTITITAQAIVANSGAYVVAATADLTAPAYTEGSTATTTITVTVNDGKVDLGGVTLAYTSEGAITTDVGTADDTGISPIWSLASTENITYSIAAAETDGPVTGGAGDTIIINQATGKITITAQAIVANSGAYTVTATAGNDSPAYTEGSTATKTITVTVNKANLNTNKLTYGVDVINVHAGTANDTGISPSWSLSSTTDITYSIAAAGASGPATDGVVANTINIASATGQITITAQAIVANSGAYVVTATAGSTSPAYTEGSTATTTITVTVNDGKVDLDDVALAYTRDGAITADVGTANTTGISPIWSLASMTGITYSIAAAGAEARGPTTDGVEGNTINIDSTGKITITAQAIVANSGAYVVTATAGSDSPAYTANSSKTTTIMVAVNKVSLSDIALPYDSEGSITTDVGTANDTGIYPSWSLIDTAGITYSIAAAGAEASGPITDGVTANTISIGQNTGMITITAQAIVANSGAYEVTAMAGNDSPAYIDGSTATKTITVTVNKIALLPLAYDSTTITTAVGTANDTGIRPSWSLADMTGITYSIAAAGAGAGGPTTDGVTENTISIDQDTGTITITDRAIATNSGAYEVTATADSNSPVYTEGNTTTTTITVTVNKIALLPLAYDSTTITTAVGTANDTGIRPSWSLIDTAGITYSIAAGADGGPTADGAGDTINIDNTGMITITDRAIATNSGAYEVTATADSNSPVYTEGNTTTTTITVTVNKIALLPLAYDPATITTAVGTASTISPSWDLADTTGIIYSIAAAETGDSVPTTNGVEGNTINIDSTGMITITDQAIIDNSGEYTVTATAEGTSPAYTDGSTATTTITVAVNKASLSDIALAYDSEGSITTDVGTANDTGIRPSWSLIDTAGITYSIAATETGDSVPTTNGVEGNTINIDSTGMITITDQAIVANSGAYVVTATADITSPVYTEGSTATTTITVTVNKIALNTETLIYNVSTITTDVGTANDTGISPSWSLADMTGITYSIAAAGAGAGGPTTDGVGGNAININSTGKITITDRAIATNSGAYTVTATAESTSPMYTEGSTTTTTITVTVNKVALLPLAYDPATITTDVGTANDTGISPSWSLIDTAGITYSIAAAGAGAGGPTTDGVGGNAINIDSTGKITITDQAIVANSGAYVVTATAGITSPVYTEGSTATTTITVTVNKIALNTETLIYNVSTITTDVGTANDTGISPSWSLADMTGITYSIAAAGAGGPTTDGVGSNTINFNQATGQITITDRAIATNSGAYTVTATADSTSPVYTEGSTTTTTITVTVNRVNLNTKSLTYNANTITTHGTANEEGISPSWSLADTAGITYSIAAAETDGPIADGAGTKINIDLGSGKITSTADVSVDNNGAYVVTATADSTSPAYIADTMTTTTIMVVDTYKIGDTGPAGGKIFYVNENYETDDWRYLEAAPTEHEQDARWGANLKMATSTDIGTGRANTELIVAETEGYDRDIGTEYAAKICSEFVLNGYDDWFLPSRDELDALYQHRNKVGGFVEQPHTNTIYWSSSASTQYVIHAWGQDDHGQKSGRLTKGGLLIVRPVRSF